MKLIIQIPCKNEETTLPLVVKELPKKIKGIDIIEYQVIDDGSTDKTSEVAKDLGIHHIIRFKKNKGLGAAFSAGMENALRQGADILVNTDADNQYPSRYIVDLVQPILADEADIVIGNRRPTTIKRFSLTKRFFQGLGNKIIGAIVGERLPDSVSGFRAYDRDSLIELNVTSKFSYVIDTIIQAYKKGLRIERIPITINPATRKSRLFKNIRQHIKMSTSNIVRVYMMYEPFKTLVRASIPFILVGLFGICRFIYHYIIGSGSGNIQSLIISSIVMQIGVTLIMLGVIADLISKNRFLIEDNLKMTKRMKYNPHN